MSDQNFLKPSARGKRDPLSNGKSNGRIMNPPRMAEYGGLSSVKKKGAMTKNSLSIKKPGDTV